MSEEAPVNKNIFQRLNDVQSQLIKSGVGKHGQAPQIMGGYAFTRADDVFDKLSVLLVENGIHCTPSVKNNEITVLWSDDKGKVKLSSKVTLEIYYSNVENSLDYMVQHWSGEAIDSGDKSTQKAATSAFKYALMKMFMIGDNEDTEDDEDTSFINDANAMLKTVPRIERPENQERADLYDRIVNVLGEDKATKILLKLCERDNVESSKYLPLETYKKVAEKVGD